MLYSWEYSQYQYTYITTATQVKVKYETNLIH